MASGGWLGHTVSKAWHGITGAVKNTVKSVVGIPAAILGVNRQAQMSSAPQATPTYVAGAAPAPTATEQAEYDVAVQKHKKKRGKNSLYVSSSAGSSGGGTGINL